MSMDAIDLSHVQAPCDDCGLLAFEPHVCGTCGRTSRLCSEHATKCSICGEHFCDNHYPAHKAACAKINETTEAREQ